MENYINHCVALWVRLSECSPVYNLGAILQLLVIAN
jgi:hypothetical protein